MDDRTVQEQLDQFELRDLLLAAIRKDDSWFNTMFDLLDSDDIANSHDAYTKLLGAVLAVGVFGGFPVDVFIAGISHKLREIRAGVAA